MTEIKKLTEKVNELSSIKEEISKIKKTPR